MKPWIAELVDAKSKIGAIVVAGAVMTHLLILGGSPLVAIILLVIMGLVAW
ncbi:MAG TPA: hypothetical protein VGC66_21150 [Pyrinomonadaceae bacterium]|jgi:hypothetical protein